MARSSSETASGSTISPPSTTTHDLSLPRYAAGTFSLRPRLDALGPRGGEAGSWSYFLFVSVTVVFGCCFAYLSVTYRPEIALRFDLPIGPYLLSASVQRRTVTALGTRPTPPPHY